MDPSIDPPPITEPAAHIAHAANPTPSQGPNHTHNHPPYAEMITAAITALKDKKGSSRQAIAKYIEKAYSNLPPTHSALLTHHLKRLKNNGHLVMVKHSYKLPRSVPLLPPGPGDGNDYGNVLSSSGPKRGPGRPRKPKPETEPNNFGTAAGVGTESVLVSLGLLDGPTTVAKRGPGRPPKAKFGLVGTDLGGPKLGKRGRGRPPRPKSLSVLMGGPKRGPGRPPRIGPTSVPGLANVPRPRGRPKSDASSTAKAPGRPRGRPRRTIGAAATIGGGHGGALIPVGVVADGLKPRGRPPRVGGVKKPRKLTGRPLGRPRKTGSITGIEVSAQQQQEQLKAYEDLRTKLEHFQSRIKQAVGVVKPCLNAETAVSAFGALQELEELATMDVSAPLAIQHQEPILQN